LIKTTASNDYNYANTQWKGSADTTRDAALPYFALLVKSFENLGYALGDNYKATNESSSSITDHASNHIGSLRNEFQKTL